MGKASHYNSCVDKDILNTGSFGSTGISMNLRFFGKPLLVICLRDCFPKVVESRGGTHN